MDREWKGRPRTRCLRRCRCARAPGPRTAGRERSTSDRSRCGRGPIAPAARPVCRSMGRRGKERVGAERRPSGRAGSARAQQAPGRARCSALELARETRALAPVLPPARGMRREQRSRHRARVFGRHARRPGSGRGVPARPDGSGSMSPGAPGTRSLRRGGRLAAASRRPGRFRVGERSCSVRGCATRLRPLPHATDRLGGRAAGGRIGAERPPADEFRTTSAPCRAVRPSAGALLPGRRTGGGEAFPSPRPIGRDSSRGRADRAREHRARDAGCARPRCRVPPRGEGARRARRATSRAPDPRTATSRVRGAETPAGTTA